MTDTIHAHPNQHLIEECRSMVEFAAEQVYHAMIEAIGGQATSAHDRAEELKQAIETIWDHTAEDLDSSGDYLEQNEVAGSIEAAWHVDEIEIVEVDHHDEASYVCGRMYVDRIVSIARAHLIDYRCGSMLVVWQIDAQGKVRASADLQHLNALTEDDLAYS